MCYYLEKGGILMKVIDISRNIFEAEVYPGDPSPVAEKLRRLELGDECNLTAMYACLHNGTHCDAPLHFIEDGAPIKDLDLSLFIGPCTVIEAGHVVTGEMIDKYLPEGCERVLFKTGGGFIHESAAAELALRGVRLVGIDSPSIDPQGDFEPLAHRAIMSAGITVLEGLELSGAEPGEYFLIAPPVNTGELEGAPVRALLISGYIFWGGKN